MWLFGALPAGGVQGGASPIAGTASLTEAADTASATSAIAIAGASSLTESADSVSAAGKVAIAGAATITEAANTISATGAHAGIGFIGVNTSNLEYNFGQPPVDAVYTFAKDNIRSTIDRIPIAWEKFQPTLGGALDAGAVAEARDRAAEAWANGQKWYFDLHNYARYDEDWTDPGHEGGPGTHPDSLVLTSGITKEDIADVAVKIVLEFKDDDGFAAFSFMNEPHDTDGTNLIRNGNSFEGDGWSLTGAAELDRAVGPNPFGTANNAWTLRTVDGYSGLNKNIDITSGARDIAIWAKRRTGTPDMLLRYGDSGSDFTVTTLTSSWQKVDHDFTAVDGNTNLQFQIEGDAGSEVDIFMAQLNTGSTPASIGDLTDWQEAAQYVVDQVAAVAPEVMLICSADQYGNEFTYVRDNADFAPRGRFVTSVHCYPLDADGNYGNDPDYDTLAANLTAYRNARDAFIELMEDNLRPYILDEFGIPLSNDPRYLDLMEEWIDAHQASPMCLGLVYWTVGQKQVGDPGTFNDPNRLGAVLINLDDTDQSRAIMLHSKAKSAPFEWPNWWGWSQLTEAADTLSAAGDLATHEGNSALTETADTLSAAGAVRLAGAASLTEGADTVSSAGTLTLVGAATITETGDALTSTSAVALLGAAAIAEAADTLLAGSSQIIVGAADLTETGDGISAQSAIAIAGASTLAEATDTLASASILPIVGSAAIVEAIEALVSVGTLPLAAAANVNEAVDTLAALGVVFLVGDGAPGEAADTLDAAGVIFGGVVTFPTDPSMIITVGAKNRMLSISAANRNIAIPARSRAVVVKSRSRVI